MRRFLLIFLSLVLALVGWSTVGAEDGFYVIPAMKGKYAPVPKTGQTTSYGTRDDGALQKGVASPSPRFTNNGNGTVTDNLTGLIWMKNAGVIGQQTWADALGIANNLQSGQYDLTDGSVAGDWRLPNVRELQSLINYGSFGPALPVAPPFTDVQSSYYWSSTTSPYHSTPYAWYVNFWDGSVNANPKSPDSYYVWCVRGGP
jgi:hypothetical protein